MATRAVSVPTREPAAKPRTCGCDHGGEETCCALDCQVRPRFFCGQLLTDQDLDALVGWTRDKLRLTRYRHGWGVVCGLEVRCDPDPRRAGSVVVGPGYAVSCCGDDIVVCADATVDLSQQCRPEPDPCADVSPRAAPAGKATKEEWTVEELIFERTRWSLGEVEEEVDLATVDEAELRRKPPPVARPVAVDLYLGYAEELTDPQTALVKSTCTSVAGCEFGRVKEGHTLVPRRAEPGADPLTVAAAHWREGYDRCLEVVRRLRARFPSLRGHERETVGWLIRWLQEHPLHRFCFVLDRLCALRDREDDVGESLLAALLFWIVQDCRNAALACPCHSCQGSPGVPLARIWLRPAPASGGACTVLDIDSAPPYRRPIGHECWPAPPGSVNVGRFIWHRQWEACTGLAELGFPSVAFQDVALPKTLDELDELLACDPFIPCGDTPVAKVLAAEGSRFVVAICKGDGGGDAKGPAAARPVAAGRGRTTVRASRRAPGREAQPRRRARGGGDR
jgi:hypothetical protein